MNYCTCGSPKGVYCLFDDWFEWDVCVICKKPIEDSLRSLNHYDGEDHVLYD